MKLRLLSLFFEELGLQVVLRLSSGGVAMLEKLRKVLKILKGSFRVACRHCGAGRNKKSIFCTKCGTRHERRVEREIKELALIAVLLER